MDVLRRGLELALDHERAVLTNCGCLWTLHTLKPNIRQSRCRRSLRGPTPGKRPVRVVPIRGRERPISTQSRDFQVSPTYSSRSYSPASAGLAGRAGAALLASMNSSTSGRILFRQLLPAKMP